MKKLLSISCLIMLFCSAYSNASVVNVVSSNGAFAGNSVGDLTSVGLLSDGEIAGNLSDDNAGTYLFGSTLNGTVSNAALTLSFQDTVYNHSGSDIAFYFMGGTEEIYSMHICFTNNCDPLEAVAYEATFLENVGVDIGDGNIYALSVISFDLTDFGFSENDSLGDFTIDLIAGGYNRLASVEGGLNVSAVPVPAAAWLFGSGLLGLIGIAKRKKA